MRFSPPLTLGGIALVTLLLGSNAFGQTPPAQPPAAPPAAAAFPPAVVAVMDGVALSGTDRADLAIRYVKTLQMPSVPGKAQAVLIFEMSAGDLKQAVEVPPAAPAAPATPPAPAAPPAPPAPPAPGVASPVAAPAAITVHTFFRLSKADASGAYLPYDDYVVVYQEGADQATARSHYTVSLTLDPGSYKLLMAVGDERLEKFATARADFSLVDYMATRGELQTSPVLFTNSIKQFGAEAVERTARVRKGAFMFSVLEISPKFDNIFAAGDSKEILYFILGAKPDPATQKFNIDVAYTLKRGKDAVIKFAKQSFQAPFVNHALPLVPPKDKVLEPGVYTLTIDIEDKVGGAKKSIDYEMQIQ